MNKIHITLVYPTDPSSLIPGGIDMYIKGIIQFAPEDILISIIGITTDSVKRPPNKWTRCRIHQKSFMFWPIFHFNKFDRQARIPLSLRFTASLILNRPNCHGNLLEFHRIEPILAFYNDPRPKIAYLHEEIASNSESRWRYFSGALDHLQGKIIPQLSVLFNVVEKTAEIYRMRYPTSAQNIHFTPTWVDTAVFHPSHSESERHLLRDSLRMRYRIPLTAVLGVSVGRIEFQKNPLMLVDALARVIPEYSDLYVIIIGDGSLRREIQRKIEEFHLVNRILLGGILGSQEIADILRGADFYLLPSLYEGMPIALLEALASGLPVVATDVGEVSRVVKPGKNGVLIENVSPEHIAAGIRTIIDRFRHYDSESSAKSIAEYRPHLALSRIYDLYRALA